MLSYPKFDLRGDQGLSKIGNAEKLLRDIRNFDTSKIWGKRSKRSWKSQSLKRDFFFQNINISWNYYCHTSFVSSNFPYVFFFIYRECGITWVQDKAYHYENYIYYLSNMFIALRRKGLPRWRNSLHSCFVCGRAWLWFPVKPKDYKIDIRYSSNDTVLRRIWPSGSLVNCYHH